MRNVITSRPKEIKPGMELPLHTCVVRAPVVGEDVLIVSTEQVEVGRGVVQAVGACVGGFWNYTVKVTEVA